MENERSKIQRAIDAIETAREHAVKGERFSADDYMVEAIAILAMIEEEEAAARSLLARAHDGLSIGRFLPERARERLIDDIEKELNNG
tara:strand:+ start:398 stop:661 length:264 start_codon:yes stop_codon:yes gene_type:complete